MAAHTANVEKWVLQELTKFLGPETAGDFTTYLLSITKKDDLEDYIKSLLGGGAKAHTFTEELLVRWNPSTQSPSQTGHVKAPNKKGSKGQDTADSRKKETKQISPKPAATPVREESTTSSSSGKSSEKKSSGKKTKYVNIYSSEGQSRDIIQLPGRHPCLCEASKHQLVNNCLNCGRIVCQQEGSGPCFFCGKMVCTPEEERTLASSGKQGQQLMKKVATKSDSSTSNTTSTTDSESYLKALAHKNRLLEYERTSARRTRVYDDEADYFASDANRWLTKEEKEKMKKKEDELREKRFGSRLNRKFTIDFAGRRVIDEREEQGADSMYQVEDQFQQLQMKEDVSYRPSDEAECSYPSLANPRLDCERPKFVVPVSKAASVSAPSKTPAQPARDKRSLRFQDRELLEMSDEGMCLSMHQPWASLLMSGVKKHEGRSWYTAHRGRLWIASAAKEASQEEISEVEGFYRNYYGGKVEFPRDYPVGYLLGSVDLVDVLPQEEYREKYPKGESESPYVFICENPIELVLKFPMKGQHKIYKLDPHIHQGAKRGLRAE